MKIFYGFISALICFLSLSFVCPPSAPVTSDPDMVAVTSFANLEMADSLTKSAVTLESSPNGDEISINRELSQQELKDLEQIIPINILTAEGEQPTTATEIIKYLISMLGGLFTTIILYFLNKRWPDIFTSSKIRDYKKTGNDKSL